MSAIEHGQAGKSQTGKIVGCIGCGCLGLIVAAVAGFGFMFWGIAKVITGSEPYQQSIAAVESNAAAVEALGEPIKPGFFSSGSISTENGVGKADFTIPVSGPKGKGTLRVVASKSSSSAPWTYETWQLDVEGGESIPLGQ